MWLLQTISGRPLYYCEPKYLIPAKILGTLGLLSTVLGILSFSSLFLPKGLNRATGVSPVVFLGYLILGIALLMASRFLIRRGAL